MFSFQIIFFLIFTLKHNIVGMHWNCLNEAIPMHTHNICIHAEVIEKLVMLWIGMLVYLEVHQYSEDMQYCHHDPVEVFNNNLLCDTDSIVILYLDLLGIKIVLPYFSSFVKGPLGMGVVLNILVCHHSCKPFNPCFTLV